ncbi:MAG TPA: GrpB family protein [Oligoflexus sp.]|uniref:GrpB family protein n=1 Tax=Oligoflexus sp. TaxID=1971216 RepID=UPI002D541F68|nr:GrpB family protein [Oligoflexus sp.]HYX35575.1 GrpB family protein [Oligoflexus sp.]
MISGQDIDEPVSLEDYNPIWPQMFETEAAILCLIFEKRFLDIQHYGSTAVPGILAKPVVDILLGLSAAELSEAELVELNKLGYEYFGEAGVKGRLYLRKRGKSNYNISVVQHQSDLWNDNIAFRDFLRMDANVRKHYEQAKILALRGGSSRLLEYSQQKSSTIAEILTKARP